MKYGTDLSNIDTEACSQNGIFVAVCKDTHCHAEAELTIGLIIAANRRILEGVSMLKAEYWAKEAFSKCQGLKD